MIVPRKLLNKYNKAVPRYTSYPPANYFEEGIGQKNVIELIEKSNYEQPENISLYIHIPFCSKLCFYCGCNTSITSDMGLIDRYIDSLIKEIHLYSGLLHSERKVSQIHWGGGTPNFLDASVIQKIMNQIRSKFRFVDQPEIAIECNPAYLNKDYVKTLIESGFNRFSLGIQDFSTEILNAVNRDESKIPVEDLVAYMKQFSGVKVNLDFIYGLPLQTPASFGNSIDKAIKISPDRLVTFSYAHLPAIKKPQKHLEKYGIPGAEEKIRLFETAYSKMVEAGYVPIGLDHFAKSTDELSISLAHKELHRNFQGYCTRKTTGQVYAFGTSSISQLESAYIQNTKNLTEYIDLVNLEHLPVKKSLLVTDGQKIVRDLINEIMCNQYLDIEKAITKFGMSTDEYYNKFQPDMASLKDLENDGIINIDGHVIELTDTGRFFIRNVAVVFDPLFKSSAKTFSKSI